MRNGLPQDLLSIWFLFNKRPHEVYFPLTFFESILAEGSWEWVPEKMAALQAAGEPTGPPQAPEEVGQKLHLTSVSTDTFHQTLELPHLGAGSSGFDTTEVLSTAWTTPLSEIETASLLCAL